LIKGVDKYEALYGINIKEWLAEELGMDAGNIHFRNDAEAFLAGEMYGGVAKTYNHSIGITLGTGLGSAFSHYGCVTDAGLGVHSYRGEMYESFISARGLIRLYREITGKTVKFAEEITALYDKDTAAVNTFELFAEHLANFLEFFIKREQPEVIVAGGSIAGSWHLFMPLVEERLKSKTGTPPLILRSMLQENAALIGAACCFKENEIRTA
jgi:glucokinase